MIWEVDFLPVGESNGDAICIRYSESGDRWHLHLVDGGYRDTGEKIIRHIRDNFGADWHINHLVLTHADNDHAGGLIDVMGKMRVLNLWMNRPWLYAEEIIGNFHGNFGKYGLEDAIKDRYDGLVQLEELALQQGTTIREVFQGAQIGPFTVLAPSRQRYINLIPDLDKTPKKYSSFASLAKSLSSLRESVKDWVDEHWNLETLSSDPESVSASNETSVVQMGIFGDQKVLLTADAGPQALNEAADYAEACGLRLPFPRYVQVPHHGSRKNVTPKLLDRLVGPKMEQGARYGVAFCSVGSEETDYPRGQVNNAFIRRGYPVWVTKRFVISQRAGTDLRHGYASAEPIPWSSKVKA